VTVRDDGLTPIVKSGTGAEFTVSVAVAERASDPLVPVNVIAGLPTGVLALVAIVTVDVPDVVTDAGENEADTPEGSPDADSRTGPVKPFNAEIVTVNVVLPPCVTVRDDGEDAIVKLGAAVTVSVAVAERVSDPLVPVKVIVGLPVGVLAAVVMVTVEVPEPATDGGENDAAAPDGSPEAESATVPVKPFTAEIVTVKVVLLPWTTNPEVGERAIVKSATGAAVTVSAAVDERERVPLAPVNVIVGLPVGVPAAVVIVTVDVPDPVTEAGENEAVAPDGSPEAERATVPVKPLTAATVTV
jgi:hypothetical protein